MDEMQEDSHRPLRRGPYSGMDQAVFGVDMIESVKRKIQNKGD